MIRLQFSAEAGIAAEAIKLYQRGWPSHVDALLPDGTLLGARLEGGVAVRGYGYAKFTRVEVIDLAAGTLEEGAFLAFLRRQLSKPYDMAAIVAFALERDWRDERRWFCSELQARALEIAGFFPKPMMTPANEVTPRDLMLAVSPWRNA